jgi:hypothetical protein
MVVRSRQCSCNGRWRSVASAVHLWCNLASGAGVASAYGSGWACRYVEAPCRWLRPHVQPCILVVAQEAGAGGAWSLGGPSSWTWYSFTAPDRLRIVPQTKEKRKGANLATVRISGAYLQCKPRGILGSLPQPHWTTVIRFLFVFFRTCWGILTVSFNITASLMQPYNQMG